MTDNTDRLLQDASRPLTDALAGKPDAMLHAREAAAAIAAERVAAVPAPQPLTHDEIADLWGAQLFHITDLFSATDFVRDVEKALGITGGATGDKA